MSRRYRVGVMGGDGIGPEVTAAALVALDAAEERYGFTTERVDFAWSGAEYLRTGEHFTAASLEPFKTLDAVLLGALGRPDVPRGLLEREVIIEGLRRGLDLYVNLRPVTLYADRLCPLAGKTAADVDFLVIRENIEDVYGVAGTTTRGGTPDESREVTMRFTRRETERIIRYAFERARERPRKRLTLVDKANAIPIQELWREVLESVGAEYPDVEREAIYVDAAAMWFVQKPERFDVVVTTNLFGDILSDLGAALAGGLGAAAGANLHPGRVSVFEPIHGSAPKYAGRGVASPVGAIGALALLLAHVGEAEAGAAVTAALRDGLRSGRIAGVDAESGRTLDVAATVARSVREA